MCIRRICTRNSKGVGPSQLANFDVSDPGSILSNIMPQPRLLLTHATPTHVGRTQVIVSPVGESADKANQEVLSLSTVQMNADQSFPSLQAVSEVAPNLHSDESFSMQSEFFHDAEAIGEPALPSMNRTSLKKAARNKLLRQSELQPYFKPGTSDAFKLKKMLKRVPESNPSEPHSSS